MIKVYDTKLGQDIPIEELELEEHLYLKPDRYIPSKSETYAVRDDKTGKPSFVSGDVLNKELGSGKRLVANRDSVIAEIANMSANFAEGVGRGLMLDLLPEGKLSDDPAERAKQIADRESWSRSIGEWTGTLAPWFIPGGAVAKGTGLIGKSLVKQFGKKTLSAVSKYTPAGWYANMSVGLGKRASAQVAKLGGGKALQGAANLAGQGAPIVAYSQIKGAIDRGREAERSAPKNADEELIRRKVNSGLGPGGPSLAETALWTYGGMGSFVLAGKGIGLGLKLVPKALKFGAGVLGFPKSATEIRKSFFNIQNKTDIAKVKSIVENIKGKKFKGDEEALLRALGKESQRILSLDKLTTRADLLKQVENFRGQVGGLLAKQREQLSTIKSFHNINFHKVLKRGILGRLKAVIKDLHPVQKVGQYKQFVDHVERLQNFLGKRDRFNFKDIKVIRDEFSTKSQWNKDIIPEGIMGKYREAYNLWTKFENKIVFPLVAKSREAALLPEKAKFSGKFAGELLAGYKRSYEGYSDLATLLSRSVKQHSDLSPFIIRDIITAGAAGAGLGYIGGAGGAGVLGLAVVAGKARQEFSRTGYKHLKLAEMIENAGETKRRVLSVAGVRHVFKAGKTIDRGLKDVGIKGLSRIMVGRGYASLGQLDDAIASAPPHAMYVGDDDLYALIDRHAGNEGSTALVGKVQDMKRILKNDMPDRVPDKGGRGVIPPMAEKAYLRHVSQYLTPLHFMRAVESRNLTKAGYDRFSRLYPHFLSMFNINFQQGVRSGAIKGSAVAYYKDLIQDSTIKDLVWTRLSANEGVDNKRNMPKRKFRRPQPTGSDLAVGGY